ncbi:ADP-ribosylglycohydrolase family protein [Candidatus Uhrbacteria bacterium]|nr:ADP-ribosylglycohydrolase family protein [Candidatus Uhrbacteria bacterium]
MHFEKSIGCFWGGAYGDTLGATVEFMYLSEIRERYGQQGITIPEPTFGHVVPVITDDTQMAIATAVGLNGVPIDKRHNLSVIRWSLWEAYQAWLQTQTDPAQCRAPGTTCLAALRGGIMGSRQKPINDSGGSGGIVRAHPVGIAFRDDPALAFEVGMESACLTHGNPKGYVPAGVLAALIAFLYRGFTLGDALGSVYDLLKALPAHERVATLVAIKSSLMAPLHGDQGMFIDSFVGQSGEKGGGWLGHDALAIALYAVRAALRDPLAAVRIAVNHSGDSDSTGSLAGALAGVMHGPRPFERELQRLGLWLERAEELRTQALSLACYQVS